MVQRALFVLTAALLLITACAGPAPTAEDEVIVFAAASLTDAMDDIIIAYEAAHPGVTVTRNYGSSSQLALQLIEGAQADVFASANMRQMQIVADAGRIAGEPVMFATNWLVLITPANNPARLAQITDLFDPTRDIALVLAAPGVPAREYAEQVFDGLAANSDVALADRAVVYDHLASEEDNVRQVAVKVALGEADAGIVYATDVTPDIQADVKQIAIAEDTYDQPTYPVGLIRNAPHPARAQSFIDFLLSPGGQSILARWGFGPPPGS